MADSHTLIIPTYNRPALLLRLVQYYCGHTSRSSLLVLDSSSPQIAKENAKALSAFGQQVRHVIYAQSTPVASKISQGIALVQTAYVSCCADDDIVFPDGIRKAVAFLQKNADFVCAHGLYLNFRLQGRDIHLAREYAGPGNEADHPGARIFQLLQRYESLFYAVFRTEDLRGIFSAVAHQHTLHFQELMQSVAALIIGKVCRFPSVYAARRSGEPAEPERDKWQTYYWFAEMPREVLEHYSAYSEVVWQFYQAHAPAPLLEKAPFLRALDLAHAVYFSAGCPAEYFYSALRSQWPGDPYIDTRQIDMFDQLRSSAKVAGRNAFRSPTELTGSDAALGFPGPARMGDRLRRKLSNWTVAELLAAAWQTACALPGLAGLNREVRRTRRFPWKCRPSIDLWWLAGIADFRSAYRELCAYLDRP